MRLRCARHFFYMCWCHACYAKKGAAGLGLATEEDVTRAPCQRSAIKNCLSQMATETILYNIYIYGSVARAHVPYTRARMASAYPNLPTIKLAARYRHWSASVAPSHSDGAEVRAGLFPIERAFCKSAELVKEGSERHADVPSDELIKAHRPP